MPVLAISSAFLAAAIVGALLIAVGFAVGSRMGWLQPPDAPRPALRWWQPVGLFVGMLGVISLAGVMIIPDKHPWAEEHPNATVVVVMVAVVLAVAPILGVYVRRRQRELGITPPPPMREDPHNGPPGWEWDGARWRRTR